MREGKGKVSEGREIPRAAAYSGAPALRNAAGAHNRVPLRGDTFGSRQSGAGINHSQAEASSPTRPRLGLRSFSRARPTVL